jgi:hypothetical protein
MSKYALIIANTDYSDPGLAKLNAPGKDAQDFARVLKAKDIGAFDDITIVENESEPAVRDAIDIFFSMKKPDDLLVMYFSGHGIRDEFGALYLAVKNTNRNRLRSTAIKSDFIRESMDQSHSRRQVLILDCCNSGAFSQGSKAATGVSIGTGPAFEGIGYGRVVLTATDATQFAWEGDKIIGETTNSLFTHFLVQGLEGEADQDKDGRITVDELYDYAYEQIVTRTPQQTPGKWSYKQQGEIVLRHPERGAEIRPLPLPEDLISAIQSSIPIFRETAIRQLEELLKGKNIGLALSARSALERIAAEDDSRRVAQAAAQVLEPLHQAEQQAEADRIAREKAEEERQAKALEEAESIAALKIEKERLAAAQVEAEQLAAQKSREENVAAIQAEAERLAAKIIEEDRIEKRTKIEIGLVNDSELAAREAEFKPASEWSENKIQDRLSTPINTARRAFISRYWILLAGVLLIGLLILAAFAGAGIGRMVFNNPIPKPTGLGLILASSPVTSLVDTPTSIVFPTEVRAVSPPVVVARTEIPTTAPTSPPEPANAPAPTPLPPPTQAPAPTQTPDLQPFFTASQPMFCREEPNPNANSPWQLEEGEKVPVLAKWSRSSEWLLVDINSPKTRTDCCWVGGNGLLNVSLDSIKSIDFFPDRMDCSSVR